LTLKGRRAARFASYPRGLAQLAGRTFLRADVCEESSGSPVSALALGSILTTFSVAVGAFFQTFFQAFTSRLGCHNPLGLGGSNNCLGSAGDERFRIVVPSSLMRDRKPARSRCVRSTACIAANSSAALPDQTPFLRANHSTSSRSKESSKSGTTIAFKDLQSHPAWAGMRIHARNLGELLGKPGPRKRNGLRKDRYRFTCKTQPFLRTVFFTANSWL
jgi:hypothetical protein